MIKKTLLTIGVLSLAGCFSGCSRVEPNYEGVKMTNWGKNGIEDFHTVKGNVGLVNGFFGEKLYQVPMYETRGGFQDAAIKTKDSGEFTVDPAYQYKPTRGQGRYIIFNYKQVGVEEPEAAMDNIEKSILNFIVFNAYREVAREYTTDDLMTNLNAYERSIEERVRTEFKAKGFDLISLTSGLEPPESMKQAIEARNNSIQQARKVQNDLEIAKMEQEKARIEQETNKIKSSGLTREILMEQWIEAIRDTNNKVIITDGKIPVTLMQ